MVGYFIFMAGCLIMARSIKLKHVTLASNESELSAQTECGKDILHIRYVAAEVGAAQSEPTRMLTDSKGAEAMSKRTLPTTKSRHVRLRDRWVQQLVAAKEAVVVHVQRAAMHADVLTHPVVGEFLRKCRDFLRAIFD